MLLSTKGRYGVMAMYDLALHHGCGPVPLSAIAQRKGLSESYLEQLFGTLRKAGLVNSIRGAQGGYLLTARPEEITVGAVIRALEGPLTSSECVESETACGKSEGCVLRGLWARINDSVNEVLDETTLQDLLDGEPHTCCTEQES